MKKFTKISLIITAILFAFGILLCLIASAIGGGWKAIRQKVLAGDYDIGGWHFGSDGIYYWGDDWDWNLFDLSWPGSYAGGNEETTDSFSIKEIERIEADLDFADIKVIKGKSSENIVVTMEKGFLKFYSIDLSGSTLRIDYHKDRHNYRHGAKITIEVPEEAELSGMDLYTAMGDIDIKEFHLTCMKTELSTAMGSVKLTKMNLTGDLIAYTAMGDVDISDGSYQSADTGTAMGSISIKGEFSGDVKAVTSMGDVDAVLLGKDSRYYNYELSCDMGDLEFNGEDCTKFMGGEKNVSNEGARATVTLESNMGDVTLKIHE